MSLFERHLVYPSDSYGGRFVEFEGPVVEVGEPIASGEYQVWVETSKGRFSGWTSAYAAVFPPKVGHHATIRIYDAGGGWYPDDRILSWGSM